MTTGPRQEDPHRGLPLLLGLLARFCHRRPRAVLLAAAVATAAAGASLFTLSTEQDFARLLPQKLGSVRAFNQIRSNFDLESQLFVLVEGGAPADLIRASDRYVERLRAIPLVAEANNRATDDERRFYREVLPRHLFLALDEKKLSELLAFLQDPAALRKQAEDSRRLLSTPAPAVHQRVKADPLDLAARTGALARLTGAAGNVALTEEGYYLAAGADAILILVKGRKPATEIACARELTAAVRAAAPEGFQVSLAGGYAVAVQDEGMIRGDMIRSSVISVFAILALFLAVFRSPSAMLRIGTPLLMALVWSMGFVALLYGKLNPLLAGSTAVIAGLGIDFSIHMMTRFRHELSLGRDPAGAVHVAAARVGSGLVIAAATTISVFYSFLASDLVALGEFGVATGTGVVFCLVATLTVLPALLAVGRSKPRAVLSALPAPAVSPVRALALSAAVLAAALWIGLAGETSGFSFEPDWRNLRPRNDPAIEAQDRIGRLFWGSPESVSLLVRGNPVEKFAKLEPALADLRRRKVITSYRTTASMLPLPQDQRRNLGLLAKVDADKVAADARAALEAAGFRTEPLNDYLEGLRAGLRRTEVLDETLVCEAGLGSILRPYLSGDLGVGQIFTRETLWERATRQRVIAGIRSSLDATGVPYELTGFKVVSGELETMLSGDFARFLSIAGGIILLITVVFFRRPALVAVALLPLFGGIALLLAVMKLGALHLNVINLVAVPMVIGLGIDDGIHLTHLYRQARPSELDALIPVCLRAVLLTTLTTVLGFGALALTQNRGVASMGFVTAVGMVCCLAPSFFTVPALLRLLNRRRGHESIDGPR